MKNKKIIRAALTVALALFGLVPQPAQAVGSLTESQAIGKAQYLVDSLKNEFVAYSSQLDSWTSDFPLMQTQLDALSLQLNAFGNRFANLGSQFLVVESTLSNCTLSSGSSSFTLICDKFTSISLYAGEGEEPSGNELSVRVRYTFNLDGELITWNLVSGYAEDSFPMDELNFTNASLDQPVTYSRNTRMLPPIGFTGLSDARKMLATEYAKNYATNYNSAYSAFPNDCANFVSQAMKVAGWKTVGDGSAGGSYLLTNWGYWEDALPYNNYTTRTWKLADSLYEFTVNAAPRGYKLGTFTNDEVLANKGLLEVGDLIFFNWEGPNVPDKDHVMIVTDVVNGVVKLSGHNRDRNNKTISFILNIVENGEYYVENGVTLFTEPQPATRWFFVRT